MSYFEDELLNELLHGGPKKPHEDLPLYGLPLYLPCAEAIRKDQQARAFLHPEIPAAPQSKE